MYEMDDRRILRLRARWSAISDILDELQEMGNKMTKKTETLVNMYYKVLELHQSDSITNKANIRMMYNAKFSCMSDLQLLTHQEYVECLKKTYEILEGGEA